MRKEPEIMFARMWPREVFRVMDGNKLFVKSVPELHLPGVYVLYQGEEPWYIGKATKLFSRLHDHANKATDDYYVHWDHFSAFAFEGTWSENETRIKQIEGILISAIPLARNSASPQLKPLPLPLALRRTLATETELQITKAKAATAG